VSEGDGFLEVSYNCEIMLMPGLLVFLFAFVVVYLSTIKVIQISHLKNLYDEPSERRKVHLERTPNLGGVPIFATVMLSILLFIPSILPGELKYAIAGGVLVFAVGLTDDLIGVSPFKKLLTQLIGAFAAVFFSDLRLTSLHGFLGITEIPYYISLFISMVFVLLLVNSFNLIDGINYLAGTIGTVASVLFAIFFWELGKKDEMLVSLCLLGSLLAFLFFNRTPAKIFLGDSGALFIGFVLALLSMRFLELTRPGTLNLYPDLPGSFQNTPALLLAIFIVPVFDTVRLFFLRLFKGQSPFSADREHIHHRLLNLHFSHLKATGILLLLNLSAIGIAYFFKDLSIMTLFLILIVIMIAFNWGVSISIAQKRKEQVSRKKSFDKLERSPSLDLQILTIDQETNARA
jgi:UDP-GlcNAc:undecaprenyl-phosphate/decaprenyl-phosphate GlcNAc-1-phosphate transferase